MELNRLSEKGLFLSQCLAQKDTELREKISFWECVLQGDDPTPENDTLTSMIDSILERLERFANDSAQTTNQGPPETENNSENSEVFDLFDHPLPVTVSEEEIDAYIQSHITAETHWSILQKQFYDSQADDPPPAEEEDREQDDPVSFTRFAREKMRKNELPDVDQAVTFEITAEEDESSSAPLGRGVFSDHHCPEGVEDAPDEAFIAFVRQQVYGVLLTRKMTQHWTSAAGGEEGRRPAAVEVVGGVAPETCIRETLKVAGKHVMDDCDGALLLSEEVRQLLCSLPPVVREVTARPVTSRGGLLFSPVARYRSQCQSCGDSFLYRNSGGAFRLFGFQREKPSSRCGRCGDVYCTSCMRGTAVPPPVPYYVFHEDRGGGDGRLTMEEKQKKFPPVPLCCHCYSVCKENQLNITLSRRTLRLSRQAGDGDAPLMSRSAAVERLSTAAPIPFLDDGTHACRTSEEEEAVVDLLSLSDKDTFFLLDTLRDALPPFYIPYLVTPAGGVLLQPQNIVRGGGSGSSVFLEPNAVEENNDRSHSRWFSFFRR
ncbi:hypothetical protein AGDE_15356 [Angomonas deanei]|uniref:Uncharacterized protein n=1 Tax=Angomonas deanei TaxID=59799 RepID=A0A7G2CB13_9TRYP|nr:hypothetical protein AGDE_15356 [Angomonas deanei]CAD2216094.1 hypothetical protein, conserved [Angomonas deanei]|eukprot:EPY19221.1 hypothetical protein AGDE_15356 [Angomonas deanei]